MSVNEPVYTEELVPGGRISDYELHQTLSKAFRQYKQEGMQIVVMLIPDKAYSKYVTLKTNEEYLQHTIFK